MPKLTVYNQEGAVTGSQELSDKVFGVGVKNEVVHQVAVAMMGNKRQVLAHTKGRGEVRGGGRKPWRQKGTGRARHGSIRSPLWVGGGVTFGPTKERNFSKKINTKMRRKAITMCLSDRVKDGKLVLLDGLSLKDGKTKEIVGVFEKLHEMFGGGDIKKAKKQENMKTQKHLEDVDKKKEKKEKVKKIKPRKVLVLLEKKDEKAQRACKNVKWLSCIRAQDVNVLDVLMHEYILTSVGGVKKIEDIFHANSNSN